MFSERRILTWLPALWAPELSFNDPTESSEFFIPETPTLSRIQVGIKKIIILKFFLLDTNSWIGLLPSLVKVKLSKLVLRVIIWMIHPGLKNKIVAAQHQLHRITILATLWQPSVGVFSLKYGEKGMHASASIIQWIWIIRWARESLFFYQRFYKLVCFPWYDSDFLISWT